MHINHSFSKILFDGNHWRHPLTWCPCHNNAHRLSTLQKVTVVALAITGVPTLGVGFLAAGLLSAYFKSRNVVWINHTIVYTNQPNHSPSRRIFFLRPQWWRFGRRRHPVHHHGHNPPGHHHSGPAYIPPVLPDGHQVPGTRNGHGASHHHGHNPPGHHHPGPAYIPPVLPDGHQVPGTRNGKVPSNQKSRTTNARTTNPSSTNARTTNPSSTNARTTNRRAPQENRQRLGTEKTRRR